MIKELNDYLDKLEEKYPHISRKELKKVIEHGFASFYELNKKGADVRVNNRKFGIYCGRAFIDDDIRAKYKHFKASTKLRLLYNYAKESYDGIYYFGLNNEEWEKHKTKILATKPKKVHFTNLKLYKIKEECFLDKSKQHFFMLYYPIDVGWWWFEKDMKTQNFKYFAKRDAKGLIVTI